MSGPIKPAAAVKHFREAFAAIGAPERAASEQAYMKTELRFHGVNAAQLRAAGAAFCKEHALDAAALRAIVDALYATDWFDLRSVGIVLLERKYKLLTVTDLPWLIELVHRSGYWAHVDFLVTKVIEPTLDGDARRTARVRAWAKDGDFWVRRTALLSQLGALRRGGGDFALFAEIAAPMLEEKEFFIRKAIGWVLREVSKKRPALVQGFLTEHGARASGLTWREATKYLPAAMQRSLARVRQRG